MDRPALSRPVTDAATRTMLWNVSAQDLFEDLKPNEDNTDFESESYCSKDSYGSGACPSTGSSASKEGPHSWGSPMPWLAPAPALGALPASTARLQAQGPATPGSVGAAWGCVDQEAPVDVAPGTPMVLWCEAKPTRQQESMAALATYFGDDVPHFVYFQTPARFTRWLFDQPRGAVVPWAVLVVGWREAKPCAMAIGAARSGDVTPLRPDARRPMLQPVLGELSDQVGVAVEAMIIMLEKPEQEARVVMWANSGGSRIASLDIHVAGDNTSMHSLIASLRAAKSKDVDLNNFVVSL